MSAPTRKPNLRPPARQTLEIHSIAEATAIVEQATAALARADSFDAVKSIRCKAKVVRQYAQRSHAGIELQNRAMELRLRAERRAGEMLRALPLRGGDRRSRRRARLCLDDLGVTQNESTRWQKLAAIAAVDFDLLLDRIQRSGVKLTRTLLLQLAARREDANGAALAETVVHPSGDGQGHSMSSSSRQQPFGEVFNHVEMIHAILFPVIDQIPPSLLQAEEKRYLLRIIANIRVLLAEVER